MRSLGDVLYNFHWIEAGRAARSAQAYAGFLAPFLRRHGIRTMINLRGPNPAWRWWRSETRVCARLGIAHRDVILSSKHLPTRSMVLALLDAFDASEQPFLVKCSGGQDRTGFAAALYLLHTRGWEAFADAEAQLAGWPYLHWPRRNQRWLKLFFSFAKEDAQSRPLRAWIETDYSQAKFQAWLEARGQRDAFATLHYEP
jgi:protein tyrosine/serine phosphatase